MLDEVSTGRRPQPSDSDGVRRLAPQCPGVAGADPDVVFICVSDFPSLCVPCATAADCAGIGGTQAPCIEYGDGEGSFCGGACGAGETCPEGFVCQEATSVDGAVLSQCLPEDGVCECSAKSIVLGLATPCVHESEFGVCVGVRICTEDGLSDCDAAAPEAEVCDGDDDDCDGEVDEDTCDDGNQCTEDACLGQEGCEYVALNGVECLDGAGPLPTMELYCDMVTDGGGWTGFTTVQAHQSLGGAMECPDPASVMGIDGLGRPYTQDGAGSHTCHYTFDVPFGFTEFHLLNYKARANAGAGYTSELATADFWKMVSWNQAPLPNGYYGDIGFGTAAQSGPVATYSEVLPSGQSAVQHW